MRNKNAHLCVPFLLLLAMNPANAEPDLVDKPSPVQVISGEDLQRMPKASYSDLIDLAPGVVVEDSQDGNAQLRLRDLGSDNTLVLINGRRPAGGTAGGQGPAYFPTDLVDRFEVMRGPQGSLYGGAATGGITNIVTNDRYEGFDLGASWKLNDVFKALKYNWFTIESKKQCDATNGAAAPPWYFSPKYDFGLPKISAGGDVYSWGSRTDGYDAGSLYVPTVPFDYSTDRYEAPKYTYNRFDELRQRIRDVPDVPEQDKRDYVAFLMFAAAFAGPGSLSDQATAVQHFDPDKIHKEFMAWSASRTDAERAQWTSWPSATGLDPFRNLPGASATTATPKESATPEVSDPFDDYAYPPDYAFDFSKCDDEKIIDEQKKETQRGRMIRLLRERDQARADHSYYMDYLRRPGQTAADVKSDEAMANEAIKTRDAKNAELRELWQNCVNPGAPVTAQADSAPAADADSATTDTRTEFARPRDWKLRFHIEQDIFGDDGEVTGKEPVPDIGVGSFRLNYSLEFKLPWSVGAIRDVNRDAGTGGQRTFSDERGIATLENVIPGGDLPDPFGFSATRGQNQQEDERIVVTGTRLPVRDDITTPVQLADDWKIYADFDFGRVRNGPTIGLRYNYTKIDSIYQEILPNDSFDYRPADTSPKVQAPLEYLDRYTRGDFSFGGKIFRTYSYPEYGNFDFSKLDKVPGQTHWENNQCGDTALPPEGAGYLTAEESPVKSLADQWAFGRVGLAGDEPTLDEFAKPVVVAVIDTGLDWNHLDFAWDNLWRNEDEIPDNGVDDDNNGYVDDLIGWSFTDENKLPWDNDGHGTAVAGIIAGTQGNDAGIDGINGSAKIMVLKALNNFGRTRASFVARAIAYAADNGAQIINLSVSPGFPKIVQDAVDYARTKGILVVAAAGNNADDIGALDPGPLRNVLTVTATGADDQRAIFSNVGESIDIAAPGVDVISLRARATDFLYASADTRYVKGDAFIGEDKRYYRATGTSFATPIVTGVASLLLSNNPGLTPDDLKRILTQSAKDVGAPGVDRLTGYGMVDARAALAADPAFYIDAEIGAVRSVEVDGQPYLQVLGIADAEQFASATIDIGQGESPEAWQSVRGPILDPVRFNELARFPIEQLTAAETWTIRLTVEHQNGRTREARYVLAIAPPTAPPANGMP